LNNDCAEEGAGSGVGAESAVFETKRARTLSHAQIPFWENDDDML
jgi:hypothetical protein